MSKLVFQILGSGFQIIMPSNDLPPPFIGVHFGMIDKEVDGLYYWCPDKDAISKGSIFPSWVLRGIADKIDRLNKENEEETSREELLDKHYRDKRTKQLKILLDVEGQKPYSTEELEATKFTGGAIDITIKPGTCYPT